MSESNLKKMRAVHFETPGKPDVLTLMEQDIPVPTSTQILIKVDAAGVNGPDLMQRKGLYPPPPGASPLLGLEVAGTIVEIGADVVKWKSGERVCGLTNGGGYAEYCVIQEGHTLPIPDNLSTIQAASLPETFFTIWSNIFMTAQLKKDEVFLIHGGAGGLGSTSIQLGRAMGAKTVVTISSEEQRLFCQKLGADLIIDYLEEDYVSVIRAKFRGADVILDIIGGSNVQKNIKSCKPDGRIIQLAFAQGSKIDIDLMPIMLKRLVLTGSTLRSRSDASKAEIASQLEAKVWPLINEGKIVPVVNREFTFEQAAEAHALMEQGGHIGKMILIPG
ncbi:MAG: NADPH2:quinone reductase [Gammaproteobacteria bacterium]|jgi:NADPH2:quinone reductase